MISKSDRKRIFEILDAYHEGRQTPEEDEFLIEFWDFLADNSTGFEGRSEETIIQQERKEKHKTETKIKKSLHKEKMSKLYEKYLLPILATAAVFIIWFSCLHYTGRNRIKMITDLTLTQDNRQDDKKMIMTLCNGITVDIDNKTHGQIPSIPGVKGYLSKTDQLVYTGDSQPEDLLHTTTIRTLTGSRLKTVLPDGTKVWLSESSILKFSSNFNTSNRVVELSGEAYFEVSQDKKGLFKVITDRQQVVVLASHFSVCGYSNQKETTTTSLKGSVEVKRLFSKDHVTLRPGQHAIISDLSAGYKVTLNKI